MTEVLLDTLIDLAKLIPYLFITFLIIEFLEDRLAEESEKIITSTRKLGPLFASLLGLLPQCGFSVMAANLYTTRIITFGTMIASFLATSDEMLPIMISSKAPIGKIVSILAVKLVIALAAGFIIDMMLPSGKKIEMDNSICQQDDCHCEENGPVKAALKHTVSISLYILAFSLALNLAMHYFGEDAITSFLLHKSLAGPAVAALIGLIPNCAASVVLTQLYLAESISFAMVIAGLLTNCGLGLLVLFRNNHDLKKNLLTALIIYLIGTVSGIVIHLLSL